MVSTYYEISLDFHKYTVSLVPMTKIIGSQTKFFFVFNDFTSYILFTMGSKFTLKKGYLSYKTITKFKTKFQRIYLLLCSNIRTPYKSMG